MGASAVPARGMAPELSASHRTVAAQATTYNKRKKILFS